MRLTGITLLILAAPLSACSDNSPGEAVLGTGGAVDSAGVGGTTPGAGGALPGGTGGSSAGVGGVSMDAGGSPSSGGASGGDGSGTGGIVSSGGGGTGGVMDPAGGGGSGGDVMGSGGGSGGESPLGGAWLGATSSEAVTAVDSEYASWHTKYFDDCGDGTACIKDGGRCVSEGVGYGMLAAVSADDQDTFDKLWAFYKKWSNANGVMDWNVQACGSSVNDTGGAADAELDAAFGLLQAASRWGEGSYGSDATALITAIKDHETMTCSGRIVLLPGDAWGSCEEKINPSYFTPAYYRYFAEHVPEQADHWNQMVTDTYDLFDLYQIRMTDALIPDWSGADGSDWYGAGYGYESVRAPWRIAVDFGLTGDARARTVLEKLGTYVDAQGGPGSVPFDKNSAFFGSFAMPGVLDEAKMNSYYSSWLSNVIDDSPYYQATLRVLFHQVAAGTFYVP